MLRRFEIYTVDPNAPKEQVAAMDKALRHIQRRIPELLHSAVGYNKSPLSLTFVWEHAYASPETYRRYMAHPFHANIIDRYLLNDSPERIVVNNAYDAGLVGYSCEGPAYHLPTGYARRVVLVRLKPGQAADFEAITEQAKAANPRMVLSLLGENTFATRWMDAVTPMFAETTYSHIWEQGYATLADAEAAGDGWREAAGEMIETAIELWYEVETGWGYDNAAATA